VLSLQQRFALHPLSEGGDNLKNAHLRRLATGASQSHGQRKKSFILLVKSAGGCAPSEFRTRSPMSDPGS
jgi:hypothetical protein